MKRMVKNLVFLFPQEKFFYVNNEPLSLTDLSVRSCFKTRFTSDKTAVLTVPFFSGILNINDHAYKKNKLVLRKI